MARAQLARWLVVAAAGAPLTACVTTVAPQVTSALGERGELTSAGRTEWDAARDGRDAGPGGKASTRDGVVAWAKLASDVATTMPAAQLKRLAAPFDDVKLSQPLQVLVGAGGGEDAFACGPARICFDADALARQYGSAEAPVSRARMQRLFAREYVRLAHRQWASDRGLTVTTPVQRALWEATVEGFALMQGLGPEWFDAKGHLTERAHAALARLAPVLVERLERLASASEGQSAELMQGLASGPLATKWGALPMALWLAEEAGGDMERLTTWVQMGPNAPLALAERHLGDSEIKMRLVALRAAI